ncbi:MAG: cytochrome c [Acidimicrobiales bacterium]
MRRALAPIGGVALAVALFAGCGNQESTNTGNPNDLVSQGQQVAAQNGCQACHGKNYEGGIAPTWIGLAGKTVTFDDGTTAVADTAYLTKAITDPQAEKVQGYQIVMPKNALSDAQVAAVVAFIESLGRQSG